MHTIPNAHYPEWTPSRINTTIPIGHHPERTLSRMFTFPNGHHPESAPFRINAIPDGHHPEWTQSRMGTNQNVQYTIPNGQKPNSYHYTEWTQPRMSLYIVTEVLYIYMLSKDFKQRRF